MAEPNIERIRSGAQTGVDRAALDAAIEAALPHTGWCPAGRRAEDGRISDRYDLCETESSSYAERTLLNVRDADGTLILSTAEPDGGTLLTLQTAIRMHKPVFLTDPGRVCPHRAIDAWLRTNQVHELNVAGPRGSAAPTIYRDARRFMDELIARFSFRNQPTQVP